MRTDQLQDATTPEKRKVLSIRADLANPIEYRKSGLSLNHIIGCPLDCAYCVRHLFSNFSMREPHALLSDTEAVNALLSHPYFVEHRTPVQIFNRATDPFLVQVKPHLFTVLQDLDRRGLTNHVLVITRFHVTAEDCDRLNQLRNLRLTLLITYSGIDDKKIEPVSSDIAIQSLKLAFERARNYRVILYWRPIIPGVNDSSAHLDLARDLSNFAHATVFTGLFFREEMQSHFGKNEIQMPFNNVARRKILTADTERKILRAFSGTRNPLFRKTSCAVAFAHGVADYNGHYGINEICDICPSTQIARCADKHVTPRKSEVEFVAAQIGECSVVDVSSRAVVIQGFNEQQRYYMQHAFGYQFHDVEKPHYYARHGRAEIGWEDG